MKMILVLALLLMTSFVWASDYTIKGNTKTQTRFIEKLLNKCEKEESNLDSLKQCLLNSRLFSEVTIQKINNETIIEVKDRWSIIPYPSLKLSSEGKQSFGAFVFDANFLGMGTLLGVGGSFSNSSSSYILFYQDKSFLLSDWTFGFSTGKNNVDVYWKNKNLEEMDAFHEKTSHHSVSLGYNFTTHFNLEGSFLKKFTSYEAIHDYTIPQEYHATMARLKATYVKEDYKFYFADGFHIVGSVGQELSRSDNTSKTRLVTGTFFLGKEAHKKQAIQWTVNTAFLEGGDKRDALKSGRRETSGRGLRGIPEGGYFTHFIATTSIDYQIPLRFTKYGTWTLAPFVDFGKINGHEKQNEDLWQKAYGIGSYFFLKGIMLPGVGFLIGRNETFKNGFAELSIGESF